MAKRRTILTIALVLLLGRIIATADTLMKGKHAVVIGWGNMTADRVEWSDCDRTQRASYVKPPYWIEKNDNCRMTPQAFGLEEKERGKYVVLDPNNFGEYFPGARKGDEVSFERQGNGVVIRTRGQSLELHSAIWKEDGSDSVDFAKQDRWEGIVTRSSKDKSTLTVRQRGTNVEKTVQYDNSTRWTSQEHGTKHVNDVDATQVNENDRVIVLGWYDDKGVLHATLISKRLTR